MTNNNPLLEQEVGRRQLIKGAGISLAAITVGGLLAGCGGSGTSILAPANQDPTILGAAQIAEALAVSMYTAIINGPIYTTLATNPADQAYLTAARDEEMYHYNLLKGSTGGKDTQTTFYFPTGMFTDHATTVNVLITLEEAFIAAYLIGVTTLSTSPLKKLAAQIMGVESEHRVLARVIANDLGLSTTTGLSGSPESVTPSNNNVYQETFNLTTIGQIVTALTPFLSQSTSNPVAAVFDPTYVPTTNGLQGNPPQ